MSWLKKADISDEPMPNLRLTPEYRELSKLIKILMQTGTIPPEAVEQEMEGRTLQSIADVVEFQERLWNLAVEVYRIPREHLVTRMWGKRTLQNM